MRAYIELGRGVCRKGENLREMASGYLNTGLRSGGTVGARAHLRTLLPAWDAAAIAAVLAVAARVAACECRARTESCSKAHTCCGRFCPMCRMEMSRMETGHEGQGER